MHRERVLTVSSYFDKNFVPTAVKAVTEEMLIDDFSMLEMMQMLHDEIRAPGPQSVELVSAIGDVKSCRNVDVAMIRESISAASGHVPASHFSTGGKTPVFVIPGSSHSR